MESARATWHSGSVGARGPMGPPGAVLGNTSFSVSASKTDRLLVKLDGISGGVSQKGFKGDVELSSFAIGEETAVGTVGGAGNGVAIQSFSFVKKPDRADPELVAHVTEGRAIKLADVQVLHVSKGAQPVEVADYKLTGVLLKSLQQKGATEVITGTFQKLTGSVGTGTNKVSTGWNVITNKAP
ncbi:MAG: type VI secretion system tube protein Hcp [Solirubrobacteraceae bacterium]